MKNNEIKVIEELLQTNQVHKALEQTHYYLQSIKKEFYSSLVQHLLLIDSINKDYERSLTVLRMLKSDTYSFNINKFIKRFNDALDCYDFTRARLYLEIIKVYGQKETFVVLDDKLDASEKKAAKYNFGQKEIAAAKSELDKHKEELLETKGAILLEKVDPDKTEIYKVAARDIKEIAVVVIGNENNKKLLLQYQSKRKLRNIYEMRKARNEAYDNKEYQRCIEICEKMLAKGDIDDFNYAKIGLSYFKLHDYKKAIKYLTIANEMARAKGKRNVDYGDLLAKLKGEVDFFDFKPTFKMKETDFERDTYGIENIDEIIDLIIAGADSKAFQRFDLTDEKICYIKLVVASSCYAALEYNIGDRLVMEVEKSKNKTPKIKKMLTRVRKDKPFYKNRVSAKDKELVLSLQNR